MRIVGMWSTAAAAITVAAALAGCAKPAPTPASRSTPVSAPAAAPTPVYELDLGLSLQTPAQILGGIIKDRRLDEKYGLRVNFKTVSVAESLAAVAEGRLPVAPTGTGFAANQFLTGKDIRLIDTYVGPISTLLTQRGSSTKNIAQAKGTKIAVPSRPSGGYWEQAVIFKAMGFDLEKDFKTIILMETPLIAGALEKGEVTLAQSWEADVSRLLVKGNVEPLFTFREKERELFGRPVMMSGWGARESWVRANTELAKRFIKMEREANQIATNNPGLADYYKDRLGLSDPQEIALFTKAIMTNEYWIAGMDPTLMKVMGAWLKSVYELGLLDKPVTVDDIFLKIPLD